MTKPCRRQDHELHTAIPSGDREGTFDAFGGRKTRREQVAGIPYLIDEFWTARQRQAHRLHEVSYRACFKPQLPGFFIERLTAPGDVVHDPFMGRGTTPLEAALRGRVAFGNDTNPLSRALVAPRLDPPTLEEVAQALALIPWVGFQKVERADLLAFYHPATLARIEGLRAWLLAREAEGRLTPVDRWIRMVALNRLTGHSSGFFSVYTLPPNQAVSVQRQIAINAAREQVPPERDVPGLILRKSRMLLSQGRPAPRRHLLLAGPSHATPEIPEASVALTVTSPPFLDVVDYEGDNWLRCWFLGVDPKAVRIAAHRSVPAWQGFVGETLRELARVTRPGGHVAFEVGEVRSGRLRLEEHVVRAAEGLPLRLLGVMVNAQVFTKTSNCWGVANNARGTNTNRIVVFRRG
jgi:DNA methylase